VSRLVLPCCLAGNGWWWKGICTGQRLAVIEREKKAEEPSGNGGIYVPEEVSQDEIMSKCIMGSGFPDRCELRGGTSVWMSAASCDRVD